VGERHLKVRLAKHGNEYEAMLFSHATALPQRVQAVYRLAVNEYNGTQKLQLTIEHWRPA
jgi:single-stranded-DNA-specific exonuclease